LTAWSEMNTLPRRGHVSLAHAPLPKWRTLKFLIKLFSKSLRGFGGRAPKDLTKILLKGVVLVCLLVLKHDLNLVLNLVFGIKKLSVYAGLQIAVTERDSHSYREGFAQLPRGIRTVTERDSHSYREGLTCICIKIIINAR